MRLALLSVGAWLVAIAAYLAAFPGLVGEPMMAVHRRPILLVSGVVIAVMAAGVYSPLMFALRSWRELRRHWYAFPLVAIGVGVIPILVTSPWKIAQPYLASVALSCFFATFGTVFGTGFYLSHVRPLRWRLDQGDQEVRRSAEPCTGEFCRIGRTHCGG